MRRSIDHEIYGIQHEHSASQVAAGLLNPVTGRRMVSSWNFQPFKVFADNIYQTLEQHLNIRFYRAQEILRALDSQKEYNDWTARIATIDCIDIYKGKLPEGLKEKLGWGLIREAAVLDIPKMVKAYELLLIQKGILYQEAFVYDDLKSDSKGSVTYKDNSYKACILADGINLSSSPFASKIDFVPAKGEALIIQSDLELPFTIKQKISIQHLEDDLFWVGSNYEWDFQNDKPTAKTKHWLKEELDKMIIQPYSIRKHLSAVRPTVKDRRPVLGALPGFNNIYVLNGMGTKGASIAPYHANLLVNHLLEAQAIPEEVNVSRFS